LAAYVTGNLWWFEHTIDDVTGLIVIKEYNSQTTLAHIAAMVMARMKPIAIKCAMLVNPFVINVVKTVQIQSCWYEEIARIDPAPRNSDSPGAYISAVNESSQ